jgi:hypothetical protein
MHPACISQDHLYKGAGVQKNKKAKAQEVPSFHLFHYIVFSTPVTRAAQVLEEGKWVPCLMGDAA